MADALFCCDLGCLELVCFTGREGGVLFAEAFLRVGFFIGSFRSNSVSIVGEYRSCQDSFAQSAFHKYLGTTMQC